VFNSYQLVGVLCCIVFNSYQLVGVLCCIVFNSYQLVGVLCCIVGIKEDTFCFENVYCTLVK
jgi:hypothetical protein